MPKKKSGYEQNIKTLEDILTKLETSELTLEESINLYTKGMKLADDCRQILDQSKRSVEILLNDSENISLKSFDEVHD